MNKLYFNLLLAALGLVLCFPTTSLSQKVKTKNEKVEFSHLILPQRPLPLEVRTYSTSISTTSDIVSSLGSGYSMLSKALQIPGYATAELGDIHLELIPSAFEYDPVYTTRKESSSKDKNGKVTKSVTYYAYLPTYLNATLRVLAQGGEVLHQEVFGPSRGAPKASVATRVAAPGMYEGTTLQNPSTASRFDIKFDASARTEAALRASIKKNWARHLAAMRSQTAKAVSSAITARLSEMGFRPRAVMLKLPTLKDGHPESDAFNASAKTLHATLAGMKPGEAVQAAQEQAAPSLTYFQELYDNSIGEDKQIAKLREAAFANLINGYAHLEEFAKVDALVAGFSEKELKKLHKDVPVLSRNVQDVLATLPIESRYAETFAEASPITPPPAEADATALYGLQSAEIIDASRDAKIGLTEVEEEFQARAYGGKGEPIVFNGVASPREVVAQGDGAKSIARFLNTQDIPAIMGKDVRGYTVAGADNVQDIDFNRLSYDSVTIGTRTFIKHDIKLNMVQRSLIALPLWFEVVYSSPNLEVYQHAPTERELRSNAQFSDESGSYTVRLKGEKYEHTNSPKWALTAIKSFAKYLDCPAVDEFLKASSPGAHYYTYLYMAELYDENCAN